MLPARRYVFEIVYSGDVFKIVYYRDMSSRLSRNFEADAWDFVENYERMLPLYGYV